MVKLTVSQDQQKTVSLGRIVADIDKQSVVICGRMFRMTATSMEAAKTILNEHMSEVPGFQSATDLPDFDEKFWDEPEDAKADPEEPAEL